MICVNIGDEKMKIIVGNASGTKLKIKKYISVETNVASTEDGGLLKDKAEFAQFLQGLLDEAKIKEKNVTLLLDNHRIVLKDMEMPFVVEKKLKLLIANETAVENKNVNNIVDYTVDEVFVNEEKKKRCRLKVAFLQSELIEELKDTVLEMGLKPVSIDIAQNSMQKLVTCYNKDELDEIFLLMDYKKEFVTIYLFSGSKLLFTKSTMMYARPSKDNETEYEFFYSEIINLLQSVINFASSKYNYFPTRVYVTGDLDAIKDSLQDMADSLSIGVRQLTPSAKFVGLSVDDFNSTGATLGALIRRK